MLEAVNVMHTSATGTGQRHETTKAVQPAAAMNRKTLALEVMFKSYLAHPYWPERERVISIQKSSGMNRQKSDDKRQAALKAQCDKEGITIAEFLELEKRASRQWYRADDDPTSEIIIPRHQVAGCLVETIGRSTKNLRGHFTKDSFRHHVQLSDLRTGKFERDGVFDRYVKLETSNMRSRQVNEYISDFLASGTVNVDVDVKVSDLSRLFAHAFAEIGVGAARKMGFGRGDLITLNEIA